MPRPNEVGAIWNDKGEDYLSITLEMTTLLELTNGVVDKVHINAYPITSDNPRAPAYQLKYYPKSTGAAPAPRKKAPVPDDDDGIPF